MLEILSDERNARECYLLIYFKALAACMYARSDIWSVSMDKLIFTSV